MQYRITDRQNRTALIEADHYEQDGSGTRFYDADGKQIASFYDGEIRQVVDASVNFEGGETGTDE